MENITGRLLKIGFIALNLTLALPTLAMAGGQDEPVEAQRIRTQIVADSSRPKGLMGLYVTNVGLGIADAGLTLSNVGRGAVEGNRLMRTPSGEPIQMTMAKLTASLVTIASAEKMWLSGHRRAAVVTLVLTNLVSAWVVNHNMHLRRELR